MSKPQRIETMRDRSRKPALFLVGALVLVAALATALYYRPALAQSTLNCEADLKGMQDHRLQLIDEFNKMAKSHAGKLDPVESCPKLKVLAGVENSFKAYMVKNKDWCNVPDAAIANVTESQSKTAALATRVCNIAEQMKKQQSEQAAGGGGAAARPKLPTGPL